MNGAGGCSLATPGRSRAAPLAAARAGAAALPSPGTPGSSSAGRPQPTVPSAGVTHSRRSASSLCSRAAPAPTANPPARAARPLLGAGDAALPPSGPGLQATAGQNPVCTLRRSSPPAGPPRIYTDWVSWTVPASPLGCGGRGRGLWACAPPLPS
ncbi:uncharacterized protein [Callorhinus ursinus]|uniref:uncharacterized protein n=1 Tax=Callorhinus ursinus TaxID=34884 RepID=UPI003CCFFA7F